MAAAAVGDSSDVVVDVDVGGAILAFGFDLRDAAVVDVDFDAGVVACKPEMDSQKCLSMVLKSVRETWSWKMEIFFLCLSASF